MSNNAVESVRTIDGLEGLFTFGVRLANFQGTSHLPQFSIYFGKMSDAAMWQTIWTWGLIAFGFAHTFGGLLAAFRFHAQIGPKAWLLPVAFASIGLLVSATGGLITALLVAGIYTNAGFSMTTTEASPLRKWSVRYF